MSYSEERIRSSLARMKKGRQASQQGRIDSFFSKVSVKTAVKRKAEDESSKKDLKKGKVLAKKPR